MTELSNAGSYQPPQKQQPQEPNQSSKNLIYFMIISSLLINFFYFWLTIIPKTTYSDEPAAAILKIIFVILSAIFFLLSSSFFLFRKNQYHFIKKIVLVLILVVINVSGLYLMTKAWNSKAHQEKINTGEIDGISKEEAIDIAKKSLSQKEGYVIFKTDLAKGTATEPAYWIIGFDYGNYLKFVDVNAKTGEIIRTY